VAELAPARPELGRWARTGLALIAVGLVTVFGIARWLNPRNEDGSPRRMETHRQLGLPPCTFYWVTGWPCPSCGMTTSFSHLAHGDMGESLRSNPAGTLLAACALIAIPWCAISATWGKRLGIRDYELLIARGMLALFGLLMVMWVIRLGWLWANGELGKPPPPPPAVEALDSRRRSHETDFGALLPSRPHAPDHAGPHQRLQRAGADLLRHDPHRHGPAHSSEV
jgi:hypothetical protein